ncbi:YaaL family protein [Desulfofundulus sp. TPOSR]|uniref:DUF2508 family protein n=1 Tax=Desulfofundulus kuznetsovii (strain DSM 6115 / VKM B-1805 / 17) TaxID=760568 RepID=A0AAU8Q6C1_DESK7|nr:DUF2508 family protein [Desulfofundulus sp. TPOSR]AEG16798.1 hypothetical protein Desku_3312 [Desulfofundulus kuznetsovii DSM 6115]NHM28833.1 YaaL family protein [Desulfofundulus sp. TPOSR]
MNKLLVFWQLVLRSISRWMGSFCQRRMPTLVEIIDEARREWQEALREFHLVDNEMVDYVIFKINTAERRFIALLIQARRRGVTAWPPDLPGPVRTTSGY